MLAPGTGDDWLALTVDELPVAAAYDWAVRPGCGAVVVFSGTVRDHAREGDGVRHGVEQLVYEAYEEVVLTRFAELADGARRRWPTIGRVAVLHRLGVLRVGASAVVVAVSAPHRDEAFEAARHLIDTLKEAAPIWKQETWRGGTDWGTGAVPVRSPA